MSIEELLTHSCDVEAPDLSTRDSSGGVVDSSWSVEFAGVACQAEPMAASAQAIFLQAGFLVTHQVVTFQTGIKAGRRLNFHDGTYLRVRDVQIVRAQGTIPSFVKLMCEEVRLS